VAIADDGDWTVSGPDVIRIPGNVGIGTATPATKLHVEGSGQFGSAATGSGLSLYGNGIVESRINHDGYGATLAQYDEANHPISLLWGDGSGTGGEFRLYRDAAGSTGHRLGNNLEEPNYDILGSARSASFDMGSTGNSSVSLPADAIGASEVLDEPGTAAAWNTGTVVLTGGGTVDNVIARTITPPAGGYILAMAGAYTQVSHVSGTNSYMLLGLNDSATGYGSAQDVDFQLPGAMPTGTYYVPLHFSAVFPASAGVATTIYLNAEEITGSLYLSDISLNLVYLPTMYGTTSTQGIEPALDERSLPAASPLTPLEIDVERSDSGRVNADRIQRELDDVRARLERLQTEVAASLQDRR
jgi:hypothetical protein